MTDEEIRTRLADPRCPKPAEFMADKYFNPAVSIKELGPGDL